MGVTLLPVSASRMLQGGITICKLVEVKFMVLRGIK